MPEFINCDLLEPDPNFKVELPTRLWVMDNHRWALIAWAKTLQRKPPKRYALIHADYHWDGLDDFHDDVPALETLLAADLDTLEEMTTTGELIRHDSFIAPAIHRGMLKELHFYCLQDDGAEKGIVNDLCARMNILQVIHEKPAGLQSINTSPLLFDLCLDLFNREFENYQEGQLWSDAEVTAFLEGSASQIQRAEAVTLSLSFGYSGTIEDTRHLASLVIPKILALRGAAK